MTQEFQLMDIVRPRTGEPSFDDRLAVVIRIFPRILRVKFIDGKEPLELSREKESFYVLSHAQIKSPSE